MKGVFARLALTTTLISVVVLGAIRLTARDNPLVAAFFALTPDCLSPCWQGIHPGETSLDDAVALLRANAWVGMVTQIGALSSEGGFATVINWEWSSAFPYGRSSHAVDGSLVGQNGIVQQIYLLTDLRFGDVWLSLGKPDGGTVDYIDDTRLRIENTVFYADEGMSATVSTVGNCSTGAVDYWRLPTSFWLRTRATIPVEQVQYPLYVRVMRTGYHRVRAAFC